MKQGKEDGNMGPMFPRLHVNDKEKGGPRAPPRNKMALYEQLTIPSNRYYPNVRPLSRTSSTNIVPSPSTSQEISHDRSMHLPSQRPALTPSQAVNKWPISHSNGVNSRFSAPQAEQRGKPTDDADFMVPIFLQQQREQCSRTHPVAAGEPSKVSNKDANHSDIPGRTTRKNAEAQDEDEVVPTSDQGVKNVTYPTIREKSDEAIEGCATSQEHQGETILNRYEHSGMGSQQGNIGNSSAGEPSKKMEERISLRPRCSSSVRESHKMLYEIDSNNPNGRNQRFADLPGEHLNRGDCVSDIPMAETVADLDIFPDDVVGIIGLKHFWKARRAITNQQRVFAVQVFELHRLIKVQKLIAGSPELLISGGAFLAKPSLDITSTTHMKKFHKELAVKPVIGPTSSNLMDESGKPEKNKIGGTIEKVVTSKGPSPIPSLLTVSHQPMNHQPFLTSSALAPSPPPPPPPPPASGSDPKEVANPWPFHQPASHQWLVPVMSPSEGLVYKPYPGPGFPGPVCGGYGPLGPTPLPMGQHFGHQAYGLSAPYPPYSHRHHNHQGMGTTPYGSVPYSGHGYFPPFGMPMMNPTPAGSGSAVDQMNHQFSGSNPYGDAGQAISGPINLGAQQQGSCNGPHQRRSDVLGSTASSPGGKAGQDGAMDQEAHPVRNSESQGALDLYSGDPHLGGDSEDRGANKEAGNATQVVRVVPHDASSASESAARIFRSIQEERKQHESS